MVFDKNVEKNIFQFENDVLNKVLCGDKFLALKLELLNKQLNYKIYVQHIETNEKKYLSNLVIDIFDKNGRYVYEYDEPSCRLMICETICYSKHGHIVGIDLCDDVEFNEALKLLTKMVKKHS